MKPLTIARLKQRSYVLGPNCRAVIWTHGCSKNCPHCIAEEMNDSPFFLEYTASDLFDWLCHIDGIEGITITGGEPFEQDLTTLEAFLRLVKEDSRQLSVMCYSGKQLSELQSSPIFGGVLKYIDILVDGDYDYRLNSGQQWRGSSNQNIHALNDRYKEIVSLAKNTLERQLEVEISVDMKVELTGIPNDGFLDELERKLQKSGYYISKHT